MVYTRDRKHTEPENKAVAERLLGAWLDVSTAIRNERFVSELTYNESIVCKLLLDDRQRGGEGLTATELCAAMQMQKSQMNRTLASMDSRGIITRKQSNSDRRRQIVSINTDHVPEFRTQHERIIEFVQDVANELGPRRTEEVIRSLEDTSDAVRKLNQSRSRKQRVEDRT